MFHFLRIILARIRERAMYCLTCIEAGAVGVLLQLAMNWRPGHSTARGQVVQNTGCVDGKHRGHSCAAPRVGRTKRWPTIRTEGKRPLVPSLAVASPLHRRPVRTRSRRSGGSGATAQQIERRAKRHVASVAAGRRTTGGLVSPWSRRSLWSVDWVALPVTRLRCLAPIPVSITKARVARPAGAEIAAVRRTHLAVVFARSRCV
mmetsp:Transcript_24154/g.71864  ORF Transcript_24154/g.71864 Transcript_24154/m.71864 type:complete len:204 (-) Transcript_24154:335-946(-)